MTLRASTFTKRFLRRLRLLHRRRRVFIALLFAFVFIQGGYLLTVMQLAMIYGMFCVGLNFFMGYTGQASFGQNAFAALGGYGTAILCVEQGWEPLVALFASPW